jgi:hypothetical protein
LGGGCAFAGTEGFPGSLYGFSFLGEDDGSSCRLALGPLSERPQELPDLELVLSTLDHDLRPLRSPFQIFCLDEDESSASSETNAAVSSFYDLEVETVGAEMCDGPIDDGA